MKQRYEPFTKTVRRQTVCPQCLSEFEETVLIHKKDYLKALHDPFKMHALLNIEKKCAACLAENIAEVLDRALNK